LSGCFADSVKFLFTIICQLENLGIRIKQPEQEIINKYTNIWKFIPIKNNMNKSKHKLTPDPSLCEERGGLASGGNGVG